MHCFLHHGALKASMTDLELLAAVVRCHTYFYTRSRSEQRSLFSLTGPPFGSPLCLAGWVACVYSCVRVGSQIASMIHDLDHPGVNNNFIIKRRLPIAILYNDRYCFLLLVVLCVRSRARLFFLVTDFFFVCFFCFLPVTSMTHRSVLENHHVALAYQILLKEENNFLAQLPAAQMDSVRKTVIELVLTTDLAKHFEFLSHVRTRAKKPHPFFFFLSS
jgi:hypothetical protein